MGEGWGEGETMKLVEQARKLRKESTDAEKRLWSHLRAHRYGGHKFKRQQPIGPYIVDLVCFDARLVIEIDGGQHADETERDSARDAWLAREGFRVLRFWNNEVLGNTEGVMQQITLSLRTPSPRARGGRSRFPSAWPMDATPQRDAAPRLAACLCAPPRSHPQEWGPCSTFRRTSPTRGEGE